MILVICKLLLGIEVVYRFGVLVFYLERSGLLCSSPKRDLQGVSKRKLNSRSLKHP